MNYFAKVVHFAYTYCMNIYVGTDHRGFYLKEQLQEYLVAQGYTVEEVGNTVLDPDDDFPEFAQRAAEKVRAGAAHDARAILLCGGAQGMAMAANRFRGIRASVVWDSTEARLARHDNDSNVLCLPARLLQHHPDIWQAIVRTWLETPASDAPRYKRRNQQLDEFGIDGGGHIA